MEGLAISYRLQQPRIEFWQYNYNCVPSQRVLAKQKLVHFSCKQNNSVDGFNQEPCNPIQHTRKTAKVFFSMKWELERQSCTETNFVEN